MLYSYPLTKNLEIRNIILMKERSDIHSAVSTTKLMNMISKENVSFTDKKRVLEFLAERLRTLEQETKLYYINTQVNTKENKMDKK